MAIELISRTWCYIRRNHLALVALFFALSGGVAWALAANTVGPRQLKANAVRSPDVKDNALTGSDIRGLTGADIDESTLAHTGECPSGLVRVADVCYQDEDQPAASWISAVGSCGALNLRLPTIAEAYLVAQDLPNPTSETDYWSSTAEGFAGGDNAIGVSKGTDGSVNFFGADPSSGSFTFRCVTAPVY